MRGGNFDGAAGVLAGLIATTALQDAGVVPARDVRIMAIRGEEGEWFGVPYIGSRSALGTLPAHELDQAKRVDSDITLYEHKVQSSCDHDAIREGQISLPPTS